MQETMLEHVTTEPAQCHTATSQDGTRRVSDDPLGGHEQQPAANDHARALDARIMAPVHELISPLR